MEQDPRHDADTDNTKYMELRLNMTETLPEHERVQLSNIVLADGLMGMDVPGEPVAHVTLSPAELARRHRLTFQQSFDNLDSL